MTDKQKMPKNKFRKIAIITGVVLVILAIIVRIGFMVAAGDQSEPDQKSTSIIQVEGLNGDAITTTDVNYKLVYTVKKPAETSTTQTTKVFLNDNERVTKSDDKSADPIRYSTGGLMLESGENKIKIVVNENKLGEGFKEVATKYLTIKLEATEKPTINITGATETNDGWRIKNVKKDAYQLDVDTAQKTVRIQAQSRSRLTEKRLTPIVGVDTLATSSLISRKVITYLLLRQRTAKVKHWVNWS